ncbi:HVO_0649 family zinc finger protein [Natrinema salifodinae]|uniref:Small CPxCG-related zinc finger protein n=1 Tax=Natrinema salifodinae TaxID=1202768 RepID=A0A1I0QX35_9EURY|nr:HVO_0649 family zinc finger protein [Natrinema salifodinae]SEW31578.1 hypothetical protein SAMN05216285_4018 [Natrinema salifodinae]
MVPRNTGARTPLERIRTRYENTDKKCPECGYVDESGNWESKTDGRTLVYRHVCPSCDASREHVFTFK